MLPAAGGTVMTASAQSGSRQQKGQEDIKPVLPEHKALGRNKTNDLERAGFYCGVW
jgi:hypothetical protein